APMATSILISARILGVALIALAGLPYSYWLLLGSKMALFSACMLGLFGLAACVRIRANPDTLNGKHIVVTGCDTGIGLALCQRLARHGAVVYAGCLRVNSDGIAALTKEYPDKVFPIQMDVTSDAQVAEAFRQVDDRLCEGADGGHFLWALVNNAGLQFSGDVELTTLGQAQKIMDVNYFGLLRVTKAFLPLLRERPGRLINVSSIRGRCAWPLAGPYTASKFAVEGLTDTLRLELARFGIPVVLSEPSHYGGATGMLSDEARIRAEFEQQWTNAEPHVQEAYGREYLDAVCAAVLSGAATSHPNLDPVLDDLLDALASDAPKDRYLTAGTNSPWLDAYKWQAFARDWAPATLHDAFNSWFSLSGLRLPASAAERLRQTRRGWFQ
ncbi:hypothetical protein BOX15_Mlig029984g1, partial [Macrostomum lignano]